MSRHGTHDCPGPRERRDRCRAFPRSLLQAAVWCTLVGAACSTTGGSGSAPESRIARVLGGLHPPTADTVTSAERWTLGERMTHYRVPAVSIAVIHDGSIQWARAYELAAEGQRRAISELTLFQAASISKPVTAFATFRVIDRGQLALDAPVNRYLRSWKLPESDSGASDSVTVARLLAHMAGLGVPGFPGYAPGGALPTLIQVLDGAPPANSAPIRIVHAPGAAWAYSGGGYVLLQQLLQDVTGLDFPTLMDRLVLQPLGMQHSTFRQPLPGNLEGRAAAGYQEDGEALPGRWHVYPELAAAGLWTTASDLARFALAVRAAARQSPRSLLTQESAVALTTPRFGSFSLGLLVRRNGEEAWFTVNGGNAGYRALLYAYLTTGEGAVVMTNADGGMGLASEIINSVALEYGWPRFIPEERH